MRHVWTATKKPSAWASSLVYQDSGQDVVEYGLLIAAIVVVVLLGMNAFGHQILPWFAALAGRITTTG